MDNGLCRDLNNHANGSTTTFPDGQVYNYTGLYYTPSCQNETYNGCLIDCTTCTHYFLYSVGLELVFPNLGELQIQN